MKRKCGIFAALFLLCMGTVGCGKSANTASASEYDSEGAILYVVQGSQNMDLGSIVERRLCELIDMWIYGIEVKGDVDYTKTGIYHTSADLEVKCYDETVKQSYDIQIAVISQEEAQALGEKYIVYTSGGVRLGEKVTDSELDGGEFSGDMDDAALDDASLDVSEQLILRDEDFTNSFTFFNYNIGYPPKYMSVWSGTSSGRYQGKMSLLEDSGLFGQSGFNIIYYSELELSWLYPGKLMSITDESDLEESVDLCKLVVYQFVTKSPNSNFCEQEIETSDLVNVNGMDMLRVTGTIQDNWNTKIYEYVAYYFAIENNGTFYPAFVMGTPTGGTLEDVEEYLDEAVKHMSKIE